MTIIDTCSFLALVRYYLPFDNNLTLFNFFKDKIESSEFIVLDKVLDECKFNTQGLVVNKMGFLKEKTTPILGTSGILPNNKFNKMVDNQFINASVRISLGAEQYEQMKLQFLDSTDAKIIICAYNNNLSDKSPSLIVTEETETNNDKKYFKKIPAICKMLDIETVTLPNLILSQLNLDLNIEKLKSIKDDPLFDD